MSIFTIPFEIWLEIVRYTDLKTLSRCICTCKTLHNKLNSYKWVLIDEMKDFGVCIPNNKETFQEYRYCIDFTSMLFDKEHPNLPEHVVCEFDEMINFQLLCEKQKMSESMIRKYYKKIPEILYLFKFQKVPIDILDTIVTTYPLNNSHWTNICEHQLIDLNFIERNFERINWHALSSNKNVISIDLLNKYIDRLFWPELTKLGLSEDILEACINKLDTFSWTNVTFSSNLSSRFIRTYKNRMNTLQLVTCQRLDEDLILELINDDHFYTSFHLWKKVSTTQKLSESFITEHKQLLDFDGLVRNLKIKRSILKNVYG